MAIHRERGEEAGDLQRAHLGRVPLAVEQDVSPDPCDVGLFGPAAVVTGADGFPDPVEQTGPTCSGRGRLPDHQAGGGCRWILKPPMEHPDSHGRTLLRPVGRRKVCDGIKTRYPAREDKGPWIPPPVICDL